MFRKCRKWDKEGRIKFWGRVTRIAVWIQEFFESSLALRDRAVLNLCIYNYIEKRTLVTVRFDHFLWSLSTVNMQMSKRTVTSVLFHMYLF